MPGSNQRLSTVGQQILSATDVDAGTLYSYFDLGADGYRFFTLQFPTVTATTISLEVSNDPETTTDANASWTDVTNALFGAPTFTAAGIWILDTPLLVARCRVARSRTNATNALILNLALGN